MIKHKLIKKPFIKTTKIVAIAALLVSTPLFAFTDHQIERNLSGFEPSYFIFSDDDENHIEFKLSIKYPLLGDRFGEQNQLYFAYTGKYDFFVLSKDEPGRESAPIISRLQNPGLFLKHTRRSTDADFLPSLKSYSVGWFHESNGQQLDATVDQSGIKVPNTSEFNDTLHASDYLSRGWDYLGVDLKFQKNFEILNDTPITYYLRYKAFCDCQGFGNFPREDDTRVFGTIHSYSIKDFDGLQFIVNYVRTKNTYLSLKARTGTHNMDALSNMSYQAELTFRIHDVPLSILYFNGYGKDISTYQIKDTYIGFGFKIW